LSYVSGFRVLEAEGLPGVARNIRDAIVARRPAFMVVDGLAGEEIAANTAALKKFVSELQTMSTLFHTSILLLTSTHEGQRLEALHTMVDAIVVLGAPVIRLKPQRTLEVSKLRGAGQVRGIHSMVISDDGATVLPRVESILPTDGQGNRISTERRPFGVEGLDRMLRGGLPAGSNTMLMGPSGIGKTMLGLHYVAAALAANERAMFVTFYERREEIRAKAERIGLSSISKALESGQLEFIWQSSVEANLDQIGTNIVSRFSKVKPARVFIDGLHGFQVTADPPERIQDFFAALADHMIAHGANLTFTVETPEILGGNAISPPFSNASRMCQNIVLLRFTELVGHLRRVISIIKMRDSAFDSAIREVTIGDRGVAIGEPITGADMLLRGYAARQTGTKDLGSSR
jgi:circadian clock protein KaiC